MHSQPLATQLAYARMKRQLTLRDVAKKAKLSYQSVHRVEHGDFSINAVLCIMKALELPKAKMLKLLSGEMKRLVFN